MPIYNPKSPDMIPLQKSKYDPFTISLYKSRYVPPNDHDNRLSPHCSLLPENLQLSGFSAADTGQTFMQHVLLVDKPLHKKRPMQQY